MVDDKFGWIFGLHFVNQKIDYMGRMVTTAEEERRFNPRLTKNEDEFVQLMNSLKLPYPKQIGNKKRE